MSGHGRQWTESIYAEDPIDGPYDPVSDKTRVGRGGFLDINGFPRDMRASFGSYLSPDARIDYLGFRCARDGSP